MELTVEIRRLLEVQLAPNLRYRTLLLQCRHMPSIRNIECCLMGLQDLWDQPVGRIGHENMFDSTGWRSVQHVLGLIRERQYKQPLIIAGPLHACSCWGEEGNQILWQELAAFSSGPGIIVLDSPREESTQGLFRVVGRLSSVDAYCLKSRLTATEDGLV